MFSPLNRLRRFHLHLFLCWHHEIRSKFHALSDGDGHSICFQAVHSFVTCLCHPSDPSFLSGILVACQPVNLSFRRTWRWMASRSRCSSRRLHRRVALMQAHWKPIFNRMHRVVLKYEAQKETHDSHDRNIDESNYSRNVKTVKNSLKSQTYNALLWPNRICRNPRFSPLDVKSIQARWNRHVRVRKRSQVLKLRAWQLFKRVTRVTRLHFGFITWCRPVMH